MNLSKSKYCSGVQCNKILWLDKYKSDVKEEIDNESVLSNGTKVGELARGLFGSYINIEFNTDLNQMISDTNEAIKNNNCIITEASFLYDNNFCSVDLLKKNGNDYEIYEVKSSTEVSDIYKEDISYQYYVLNNIGLNVVKCCIVYINNQYVRNGELELDKLFNIEDVTEYAKDNLNNVKNKIIEIREYMKQNKEPIMDIGEQCFKPYDCSYFKYCSRHLGENNVFEIRNMQLRSKLKLYNKGIYKFEDLLKEDISDDYKEQIEYELYDKGDKINVDNIKEFMNTLYYPLYFLDFETFQQSIPLYDGISPYEQIPFQYSIHYIEKDGDELKHIEYLAEPDVDPRRDLAEHLVKDIPSNACVIAYNMKFEKMVIKKLSTLFSDLSDDLMNIYNNIYDIMIPFKNRDYYNREMQGSFSIKYVLPALFPNDPSLDYHNLEQVHNGSEASNTYSMLGTYSKEEQEKIRKNMLKYCELDTYAMVKIYNKLKQL